MASKVLLFCLFLAASSAAPQKNTQAIEMRPTGQEFVDLLQEDFTEEEYEFLLDEFVVS